MRNEITAESGERTFGSLSPEDFRNYIADRLAEKREFVANDSNALHDGGKADVMLAVHPEGRERSFRALQEEPLAGALTLAESIGRQSPGVTLEDFWDGLKAGAPFSDLITFFDSSRGAEYKAVFSEVVSGLLAGNTVNHRNGKSELEGAALNSDTAVLAERSRSQHSGKKTPPQIAEKQEAKNRPNGRRWAAGILGALIAGSTISYFWQANQHTTAPKAEAFHHVQQASSEQPAAMPATSNTAAEAEQGIGTTKELPLDKMHCVNGEQIVRGVRLFSLAKKCGVSVEAIIDHSGLLGSLPGDVITGTSIYYTADAPTAEQARVERAAAEAASNSAIQACATSGVLATPARDETNYALVKRTFPNATRQQVTEIAGGLGEHLPHQVVCIKTAPATQPATVSEPVKSIEG